MPRSGSTPCLWSGSVTTSSCSWVGRHDQNKPLGGELWRQSNSKSRTLDSKAGPTTLVFGTLDPGRWKMALINDGNGSSCWSLSCGMVLHLIGALSGLLASCFEQVEWKKRAARTSTNLQARICVGFQTTWCRAAVDPCQHPAAKPPSRLLRCGKGFW